MFTRSYAKGSSFILLTRNAGTSNIISIVLGAQQSSYRFFRDTTRGFRHLKLGAPAYK